MVLAKSRIFLNLFEILDIFRHWQLCTVNREDLGMRLSCFGCEKKNGRKVGGAIYSFHDKPLSKNIARRQLNGQHLLFGVYLKTLIALYLLNMHYRGELNIDDGKNVLACF